MTALTPALTLTPLSFGQEQLWFLEKLNPGNTTYNILLASRLRGVLHAGILGRSLDLVVARHEALRTSFPVSDGLPFQVVSPPEPNSTLVVVDYSGLDSAAQEEQISRAIQELSNQPFDLENGPLFRYRLFKLADDHHVFVQNLHHMVTDGWSSGVVNRDILAAYQALLRGADPTFDRTGSNYADFARAQREQLRGDSLAAELDYWTKKLADLPTLELPADRLRPPVSTRPAGSAVAYFDPETRTLANRLAQGRGVSLFMVLSAALNVVLSRYTGQEDIPIGVPMLNRAEPELEDIVGLFVNMVVLRSDLSGDPTFNELLERTLDANLDLYEHQDAPFHMIVDQLQPIREPGRNPLFQVSMQVLGNANSGNNLELPGVRSEPIVVAPAGSRFDMAIDFVESAGQFQAIVEYSADLYDGWRVQALLNHIESVVVAAAKDPTLRLSELPIVTAAERRELLSLGQGELAPYAVDPLHVGFARIAQDNPSALAVTCRDVTLTYGELDRRADLLARHLRFLGVRHGEVVALVIDRDLDAYVAMVGILKAGAAFAVMDPKLPAARLDFMIRDTSARVVLTRSTFVDRLPAGAGSTTLLLDTDWPTIEATPAGEALQEWTTRESLAYVLYTSGSTGSPKGVAIAHRAVSMFCEAYRRRFDFGPQDRLLQLPALHFDMSQGEIWTAFLVGAVVIAVAPEDVQSPEALAALMRDQRVTYAGLPPAMQSVLDPEPYPALKYVMGGAEVLPPDLVNKWNVPGRRYLNLYGPTECAIGQTDYEVEHVEWKVPPPIGRPQLNRQVYVVDQWNNLVPKGVSGELLIGGEEGGLALGYLNQPQLTAEKFIADPFQPDRNVYRSGDLVRWNNHGQIEFLGRLDNQVKLRGLRIELGEIETALQSHPQVSRAVVLMRPDRRGENQLVGYFTAVPNAPEIDSLRAHLAELLPEYMVPNVWVPLAEFPMNNDGWKINRKALPDPVDDIVDTDFTPPRGATEKEVARGFAEVLSVARVGAGDNFFRIGGNSLQALRLVSRINKTFQIKISVRLLYGNATVSGIAGIVDDLLRTRDDAQ